MSENIGKREERRLEKFALKRAELKAEIAELRRVLRADANKKIVAIVRDGIKNHDPDLAEKLAAIIADETQAIAAVNALKPKSKKPKSK